MGATEGGAVAAGLTWPSEVSSAARSRSRFRTARRTRFAAASALSPSSASRFNTSSWSKVARSSSLILSPPVLGPLRRELRRLAPGLRISEEDLATLLQLEVLKRDALEGDKAEAAAKRVRRAVRKRERERAAEESSEGKVRPTAKALPSVAPMTGKPVGAH